MVIYFNRFIINGYNHVTGLTWWATIYARDYDHAVSLFTAELDGITDCINVDVYNSSRVDNYSTEHRVITA